MDKSPCEMSVVGSEDKESTEQTQKKSFLLSLIDGKRKTLVRNDDAIELFHVIDLDNDEWTTFADGYGSTSVVSILSDVFEAEIVEGLDLLSIDISVPEYNLTLENVEVSFKAQTPLLRLQDLSLMTNMSITFKKTKDPVVGGARFVRMSPEDKEGAIRIRQLMKEKKENDADAHDLHIAEANVSDADMPDTDVADANMIDSSTPAGPGVEAPIENEVCDSPLEIGSQTRDESAAHMDLTVTTLSETITNKSPSYKEYPSPRESTKEIVVSLPERGRELAVVFNQDARSNRINVVRSRSSRRILRAGASPTSTELTSDYDNKVSATAGNLEESSFNNALEDALKPDLPTENMKKRPLETDPQLIDLPGNQESLQKSDPRSESLDRTEILDFDTTIQESSMVIDDETMMNVDDINYGEVINNEGDSVKKDSNPTYEVEIEMPSCRMSLVSTLKADEHFKRIFRSFKRELLDSPMTPEGYNNRKLKIWTEIDGKAKVLDRHDSLRSLGLIDSNFEIKLTAEWRDEKVEFQLMPFGDNPFTGRAYFRLSYGAKFKKAFSKYLQRTGYTLDDSKFYLKRDDFLMEISPEERPSDVNLEQNEKILVVATRKSITPRE